MLPSVCCTSELILSGGTGGSHRPEQHEIAELEEQRESRQARSTKRLLMFDHSEKMSATALSRVELVGDEHKALWEKKLAEVSVERRNESGVAELVHSL